MKIQIRELQSWCCHVHPCGVYPHSNKTLFLKHPHTLKISQRLVLKCFEVGILWPNLHKGTIQSSPALRGIYLGTAGEPHAELGNGHLPEALKKPREVKKPLS